MEYAYDLTPDPAILLQTLQAMLAVTATDLPTMVDHLADVVTTTFHAEKVDVFLADAATASLIAAGVSSTPMGQRQQQLGLDRLPLAHGGHAAHVYHTGQPFQTNHADATSDAELRAWRRRQHRASSSLLIRRSARRRLPWDAARGCSVVSVWW